MKFAKKVGEYTDDAGSKRSRDSKQERSDIIVLAHCFSPLIPFEATDNLYFRLAYADAAIESRVWLAARPTLISGKTIHAKVKVERSSNSEWLIYSSSAVAL
jgi:hypothetical protein